MRLTVDLVPQTEALQPRALASAAVAVIDLLRATTTITAALQANCRSVIPCATVSEARQAAKRLRQQGGQVILAGERGGLAVPGFDKGNSPAQFRKRSEISGKTVILTTSNGTRALHLAGGAKLVLTACLNNLQAVSRSLAAFPGSRAVLLAAGESGEPAEEDLLTAGLLLEKLLSSGRKVELTLRADLVYRMSRVVAAAGSMRRFLFSTPHGRDLARLGFESDIHWASRLDTTSLVGVLTPAGIVSRRVS